MRYEGTVSLDFSLGFNIDDEGLTKEEVMEEMKNWFVDELSMMMRFHDFDDKIKVTIQDIYEEN